MRRLTVVLLLVVLAPSTAQAAGLAPWYGSYRVTVSGRQTVDWTLNHPPGRCDAGATGSGRERVDLLGGTATVEATGAPGSVIVFPAPDVAFSALVDRQGTVTDGPPPVDDGTCPVFGGGDGGGTPPAPDCGPKSARQHVFFTPGTNTWQADVAPGAGLDQPLFQNCPVMGQAFPSVVKTDVRLLPALFGPSASEDPGSAAVPDFDADGVGVQPITDADTTGTSQLQLKVRFTRLVAVPLVRLPVSAKALDVGDGAVGVPLTCPAGTAGCRGTVTVALGGAAADRRAAGDGPTFPAPVALSEPTLASTAFRLRPGARATVRLPASKLRGPARNRLRGLDADVVLSFGSGSRRLRYVAASLPLRVR